MANTPGYARDEGGCQYFVIPANTTANTLVTASDGSFPRVFCGIFFPGGAQTAAVTVYDSQSTTAIPANFIYQSATTQAAQTSFFPPNGGCYLNNQMTTNGSGNATTNNVPGGIVVTFGAASVGEIIIYFR